MKIWSERRLFETLDTLDAHLNARTEAEQVLLTLTPLAILETLGVRETGEARGIDVLLVWQDLSVAPERGKVR